MSVILAIQEADQEDHDSSSAQEKIHETLSQQKKTGCGDVHLSSQLW
jgi:hypothetical protein